MSLNLGFWSFSNHLKNKVIPSIKDNKKIVPYMIFSNKRKILRQKYLASTIITKNKNNLLNDKNIKYIYISSITKNHFKNSKDVIKSKKNVICEKPICNTAKEFKKLLVLAKRNKVKVFEFYHYIHHPLFKKLQEILKKNILGNINYIESHFTVPLNDKRNFRFKKKLGGGALMDVGVYPISLPFFLYKNPNLEIIKKNINFSKKNKIDTSGSLIVKIKKKILGNFHWGFNLPYRNNLSILGEKGCIEINFFFSKKIVQEGEIKILLKKSNKKVKVKKFNQINWTFKYFLNKKNHKVLNIKSLNILRFLDKIKNN